MENQTGKIFTAEEIEQIYQSFSIKENKCLEKESPNSRSEDVLVAVATLGLLASIADGEPDYREIGSFISSFQEEFGLPKCEALKMIGFALKQIRNNPTEIVVDCPCETLNQHLSDSQKLRFFNALSEILIADQAVDEREEYFLDYVAHKLNIVDLLKQNFLTEQY